MTGRVGANTHLVSCHDCGRRLLPDGRDRGDEWFMVHDHLWDACGLEPLGGCLCIGCLEARLGRPLEPSDLTDEWPINQPRLFDSPRMHALKVAAARHHAKRS